MYFLLFSGLLFAGIQTGVIRARGSCWPDLAIFGGYFAVCWLTRWSIRKIVISRTLKKIEPYCKEYQEKYREIKENWKDELESFAKGPVSLDALGIAKLVARAGSWVGGKVERVTMSEDQRRLRSKIIPGLQEIRKEKDNYPGCVIGLGLATGLFWLLSHWEELPIR